MMSSSAAFPENEDFAAANEQQAVHQLAQAALYALDALEISERDQVREAIARSPEFAQTVDEFSDAAHALPYALPPVALSESLKGRLFQRIAQETVAEDSELYQLLQLSIDELKQKSKTVAWQPMVGSTADAYTATLEIDESHQKIALFVKANRGGHFPRHTHDNGETLLMLEGDLVIDGLTYTVGDRIDSSAQSIHRPETLGGCLVLCITSLNDEPIE
ncbi:MAG: cupin domain-containing protein [Cyanobacteria bacterium J06635_11]